MLQLLIADDDAGIRRLLGRVASRCGYACVTAKTAQELIRFGRRHRPDAIISDVDLGDGDGIESCLTLRSMHPGLPIAIMTGDGAHVARARGVGFELILRKPFTIEEMESVLRCLELRIKFGRA